MRILVVGTLPGAMDRAESELAFAGHEVMRCHESGDPPFPCAALRDGGRCPLEEGPVDVAVAARDRPWPRPSPYEDGAVCALRRRVPLVVAGGSVNPFAHWAAGTAPYGELAATCEQVAASPLAHHSEIATDSARAVLEHLGGHTNGTSATVHRRHGRLHVELALPSHAAELESSLTAKIVTDLRAYDPYAAGIDVSIV